MKKIFYTMFALAVAAMTFTSCEDVPMPYDEPVNGEKISEDTTETVVAVPTGDGTKDNPFNAAMAIKVIQEGTFDATTEYYVKGRVSQIDELDTGDYGNATYYLSDDGTTGTQFEIYRGYGMGGDKFTSTDQLELGDSIIAKGKLVYFKSSVPEMAQGGAIVFRNGVWAEEKTEEGTTVDPAGTGTAEDPYNVAAVHNLYETNSYDENVEVYVKGIISKVQSVDTGEYGNAIYYISDDGTSNNDFEIYYGYYLNGEKFTSANQIQVGQTVVVCGNLTMYKTTREMAKGSKIVSIGSSEPLNETFTSSIGNFEIVNESLEEGLSYVWKYDENGYMKASAYANKKNYAAISYLISPAINLSKLSSATLSFSHTGKYFSEDKANDIKVVASTDKQNWIELKMSAYPTGSDWKFVDATCDLSAFAGKSTVYIAFKYISTSSAAAIWEVKNVVVK